jgi:HipA-like C-terminal domain
MEPSVPANRPLVGGKSSSVISILSSHITSIKLFEAKRIDAATLETVRFVETFGALIANTDRHMGNLACIDRYDGRFELAPIYDMLPMRFAPTHDEIVARECAAAQRGLCIPELNRFTSRQHQTA